MLLLLTMAVQVSYVPCAATGSYQEEDVDSAKQIDSRIIFDYRNNKLNLKYQTVGATKTQDCYFKLKQKTYAKKTQVKKLYYGTTEYWDFNSENVSISGNTRYCLSQNRKKKEITITVYNGKMKQMAQSTFSIADWIDKKLFKNKTCYMNCHELKILNDNKVQLLYEMHSTTNKIYYGGIAVLNLKNNKEVSNKKLSFVPWKSDDTYIYGSELVNEGETTRKLYIAKRKTGKVLKTYRTDYGVDFNLKDQYLVCGNPESEITTVASEDNSYYVGLSRHDFYKGQVIIANYSGIYLGSVKTDGLEKIADLSDLNYYANNYKQQMIFKIALKSRSEFSVVYADSWDDPNIIIKRYKAK